MAADLVTKRLHVAGITPNITTSHIKERFSIFGHVREIEELQPNALGDPRPFTFLTIETSSAQLKKCLNIMSGSTWRGATLRLAEAKPKYQDRLAKERNPTPESLKVRIDKKRKRSTRENAANGVGKESQDMRMPSLQNYKTKKYWSLDPNSNLIRPLSMRPTHPLPPPAESNTPSIPLASTSKRADRPRLPPKRARRRVIDPQRWGSERVNLETLEDTVGYELEQGWEYNDLDSEDDEVGDDDGEYEMDQERKRIGTWKRIVDGEVLDKEDVFINRRRVIGEQAFDLEDEIVLEDDGSELFGHRSRQGSAVSGGSRGTSPLFPREQLMKKEDEESLDELALDGSEQRVLSRSVSPLFVGQAISPKPSSPEPDVATSLEQFSTSPKSVSSIRSESPLFASHDAKTETAYAYSPSRPVSLVTDQASSVVIVKPVMNIPQPLLATVRAERSRDLYLLRGLLGDDEDLPTIKKGKSEWAGFEESDDEDAVERRGLLRLRGGAGSDDEGESEEEEDSSEDAESSEDSSSDSSDSESDSSDQTDGSMKIDDTKSEPANDNAKPTTLKDMFAPSARANAGNFSLFADVDIDLDEEMDIPLQNAQPSTSQLELEPLLALPQKTLTGIFELDPSAPLFFATPALGNRENGEVDGFWRGETDEEMRAIWERDRLELTREWKRRYRDARKQKRRRGGAEGEVE